MTAKGKQYVAVVRLTRGNQTFEPGRVVPKPAAWLIKQGLVKEKGK